MSVAAAVAKASQHDMEPDPALPASCCLVASVCKLDAPPGTSGQVERGLVFQCK